MRIGFHYHVPVLKKENGDYYTSGAIGIFIDSLAQVCDQIICFMYTALHSEMSQMDYKLERHNIRIVEIGPHDHFFRRVIRSKNTKVLIDKYMDNFDLMLIRGPSPLLPAISALCESRGKPYAYLLVGDYVKSLEGSNLRGLKRFLLKNFYTYNKKLQDHFARNALVFVNSTILFDEYKSIARQIYVVKTTTLSKEDFFTKNDITIHDPVELLYTGRIEPAKGLGEVLEAMSILRLNGMKTVLNLVGWEDKKGYLDQLMRKAKKLGLEKAIVFHGKKKVGKELFSMYRKADIYVIASKGNEGFPRTIWEAMANSLPVVASRIGSIPYYLDEGKEVLLVEPGNIADLVEKLLRLISDSDLRQKMIVAGLNAAKDNTLQKQAMTILTLSNDYLESCKNV